MEGTVHVCGQLHLSNCPKGAGPGAPRWSSAKGQQQERKVSKRSLAEVELNVIPLRISPTACPPDL